MKNGCLSFLLLLLLLPAARAQRPYKTASVLASGQWYKISVLAAGVYKVDLPLLNKLGVNTANLSSASIRLFGNGGRMLPEACNGAYTDDLLENAIQVVDGGDGIFNGDDYFLFYAPCPDNWVKDSANHKFIHQKNLYSTKSFYFITIGGAGRRVQPLAPQPLPNITVASFSERYFSELDSINLLNSGKNWYTTELSNSPGHVVSMSFPVPLSNIIAGQPATLVSSCAARTIGGSSRFTVTAAGSPVLQQDIAPTGNLPISIFCHCLAEHGSFTTTASPLTVSYNFTPGGINAQGWIDWFEVFCRRDLAFSAGAQLLFRDWNSVGPGNTAGFTLKNGAAAQVWDITDPSARYSCQGEASLAKPRSRAADRCVDTGGLTGSVISHTWAAAPFFNVKPAVLPGPTLFQSRNRSWAPALNARSRRQKTSNQSIHPCALIPPGVKL